MGHKKALDLGCGTGRNSLFLARKSFDVIAADISINSLNILKDILIKEHINNIKPVEGNFKNLQFENNFFDVVVSSSTLHHARLEEIKKGINEVRRVLKPDGCFIFDLMSSDDISYGQGKEVETDTYLGSRKGEEGIIHHYTNLEELKTLLKGFSKANIYKREYRIKGIEDPVYYSKVFDVIAYN